MKSEYRCLVEMIISDERKLAEATKLHAEALERFQKAAETLVAVSKRLDSRRIELSRLDELLDRARPASGGGKAAPQDLTPTDGCAEILALRGDVKSLQASVRLLCRESVRTEI